MSGPGVHPQRTLGLEAKRPFPTSFASRAALPSRPAVPPASAEAGRPPPPPPAGGGGSALGPGAAGTGSPPSKGSSRRSRPP